ncbi:unnamed protein product [Dibothriocephalus latus]|uniref:Uncharacterized protein n=1 Tax=Dibothriocephalus latus TaxID=60516 RepID=A0A3P6T7V3_DIBLA|nr:unnamed protein product [Dibothriocephalus latus]
MITEHECPTCEGANNFSFNACHQLQFQSNNESSVKFLKVCNPHFCVAELEESCPPLSIASSRGRRSSEESSATTLRKYYDGTASTTPTSLASPTVPFDALKATDKYVSKVLVRLQSKTPQPKFPERQASTDFDTDSGTSSATESLSDADTYLAWPARLISDNQLEVYGGSPSIRVDCIKTESIPPPPLSEFHVVLPSACPSPPELPFTTPSEFSSLKQTAYFKRNEKEKAKSVHLGCSAHEYCENSRLNKSESPNVEVEPFSTPSPKSKSCSQASSLELPPSIFAEGAYPPSVKGHVKRFVSMLEVKISSSDSRTRRSESTGTGYSKFSLARRMNAFAVTSKIRFYSSRCELISPLNDSGSQTINHSGSNSIKSHGQTTALSVEGKPQKSTSQKACALISELITPENKKVERNGTPDRNDSNGTPTLGQSMRLRRMRPQQELTEIRTVKSSQGFDRHPVTADSGNCGVINPVCTDRISKAGHKILLQSPDSRCSKQSVKVNLQSGSACSQIPVSLLKLGTQKTDNTVRSFAQLYIVDTEPEVFNKVRSPTTMEHNGHLPKLISRPLSPKVLEPHEISFGEKSGSGKLLRSQNSPPILHASTPATQMSLVNNAQPSKISKESAMPQGKQSLPPTQCSINYLSQNLPVVNPAPRTHDDLQLHREEVREHRILFQKDTHSPAPLINERLAEPAISAADVWSARNNRSLLFNSRHSSENVSPVKTEQHLLINKFLGIGNSPLGDFSSSAIEYRLLDVPPKVAGGTSVRLALPLAGLHGQLSSKEDETPFTLAQDCASSPNQMTKMLVGSLQLVREVHGTLPLEIAGLSLLPTWHGDGDGILSTYQLPPRRYSLRVSGGRASRLQNSKNLFQTSYEKPIPTPDVQTTSLSNAPQRDSSPVRATVGVAKGAVSENRCRWTAIPNMRRGSHVFMSDLWPEIIQRRDREGNSASSLQGYSCKLFSLESEKQEGSERLPGLKATGSLPAMQRQFMLETTAIVDSTLTPEITERYEKEANCMHDHRFVRIDDQPRVDAVGGKEVHTPLHVLFRRSVECKVVREKQVVDCSHKRTHWGLYALAIEKVIVDPVGEVPSLIT